MKTGTLTDMKVHQLSLRWGWDVRDEGRKLTRRVKVIHVEKRRRMQLWGC
jgi:hypothetical protein